MSNVKEKLQSFFRKNKEVIIGDTDIVNNSKVKNVESKKESILEYIEKELLNMEANEESVKVWLRAYKGESYKTGSATYNKCSGRIVCFSSDNDYDFNQMNCLDRVSWYYHREAFDVVYGFMDERTNILVSSDYVLNILNIINKKKCCGEIFYDVRNRKILIEVVSDNTELLSFKAFSVCGIVHINKELKEHNYEVVKK